MTTKKETRKSIFTLITKITSVALAIIMCLSMALPVFAYSTGEANKPAEAAITKRFRLPLNTPVPTAAFTFEFTKIGIDDTTDTADMPDIDDKSVSFPSDATTFTEDGDVYLVKETSNIADDIKWPAAGVYKYQVSEKSEGITATGATNEGVYYSPAKYDIEFWVEKDTNGNLFVKYINAITVTDYVDEYYEGTEGGDKVEPKPGGNNPKEAATMKDNFSQVMFTNKYWKSDGGGEKDPTKTALEIVKAVAKVGAEKDKHFSFNVKVIQPDAIKAAQTYMAYILDDKGNIKTITSDNYSGIISHDTTANKHTYIQFTSDEMLTVNLKHGERLAFADLHVGSAVEVEEMAAGGYTATYQRTFSIPFSQLPSAVTIAFTADKSGINWGFPRETGDPADKGPHYTKAGNNSNIATFINERTGVAPTGISVDNLPYIVLIAIGFIALVSFAAIKFHRNMKHNI